MSVVPVIAIDGPSGSGKGTVAREVAQTLGWHLLDSGALYRLAALAALRAGVGLDDEPAVAALAGHLDVAFERGTDGAERIRLAGEDVTAAIRTETAGDAASRVAAMPGVRSALVDLQRGFRRPPGLVADGRDMGSVIFPDAALKIFLTASTGERANRRYKQLKEQGIDVSLAALSAEIAERDRRDASRAASPLAPSSDAILVDSTGLIVAEVVSEVLRLARRFVGDPPADGFRSDHGRRSD